MHLRDTILMPATYKALGLNASPVLSYDVHVLLSFEGRTGLSATLRDGSLDCGRP